MKLTLVLLTAAFIQVNAAGYSQTLTLSVKNAPLTKVFSEIEKQSKYSFIFADKLLNDTKPVTLHVRNEPIETVLSLCFKDQPLTYDISTPYIVVRRKGKALLEPLVDTIDVKGKVVDEQGKPVQGISLIVKGTAKGTTTNAFGEFSLQGVSESAVIVVSGVSFQLQEIRVNKRTDLETIRLKREIGELQEATVVSTGYQNLPKERVTGSFEIIDQKLLNRRVSTNFLDRLEGVASGVSFIKGKRTQNETLGVNIRGRSTLDDKVSADPLIVLDNVAYEGDINNINPNDIESITILKDAAAASIWGARAGNGVIVITSKKGKLGQKLQVDLNSNISVFRKPDIYYPKTLSTTDFIDVEMYLYERGYFNNDLNNQFNFPPISPVVEILSKLDANVITSEEATAQINHLRSLDVRRDYSRYIYQNAINQQYSASIFGGTANATYRLSLGYDNNRSHFIRNGSDRLTINSSNSFKPIKNLEITTAIVYTHNNYKNHNQQNFISVGGKYVDLYPYGELADAHGNALPVQKDYRSTYVDSMAGLGFLDWRYRPLDEIRLADNTAKQNHLLLRASAKYSITPSLSVLLNYAHQVQQNGTRNYQSIETYYSRNLVNRFAQRDAGSGVFIYPVPKNGILDLNQSELRGSTLQGQLNYSYQNGNHGFYAFLGGEVRQNTANSYSRRSYGYDDEFGTSVTNIDFRTPHPVNPIGTETIQGVGGNVFGETYRYLSFFGNAGYTLFEKYTATFSFRKDGANIFGVKTNDRITPLWSAGIKWDLNKEGFYNIMWLPRLSFRATYGYNGNVYNGSAYLTAFYLTSTLTGLQTAAISTAPNSELRWEKVRNINVGIDFAFKKQIVSGSIEVYQKEGLDLIEDAPLAPSTGFTEFKGNAASTKIKGVDVTLNIRGIDRNFKWHTDVLFQYMSDKVTAFDPKYTTRFLTGTSSTLYAVVGNPIFSLYSYRWAGLDPENGDPMGIINGHLSKDYAEILTSTIDNIVLSGPSRPKVFGSIRNTFSYKGVSLSINLIYKFKYFFRRDALPLNYTELLGGGHSDYTRRWQNKGDEAHTDIPSLLYPSNDNRSAFYQSSEATVEKGDHVRLQDINLSYDINSSHKANFRSLQLYVYANNLGLLWKSNDRDIDPDYNNEIPLPPMIAFGVKLGF